MQNSHYTLDSQDKLGGGGAGAVVAVGGSGVFCSVFFLLAGVLKFCFKIPL